MSEFTCADCGDVMLHGKCVSCGGTRVGTMDGKSAAELASMESDDWREAEDMRMEMEERSEEEYDEES